MTYHELSDLIIDNYITQPFRDVINLSRTCTYEKRHESVLRMRKFVIFI